MSEQICKEITILIAIIILFSIPISAGSYRPTVAIPLPPGIVAYVPVTLTNNQSTNVTEGTQILLKVDWNTYDIYLSSNVSNVEFFNESWEPLYAWMESNGSSRANDSYVWVRLDNNGIDAGRKTVIYLAFLTKDTNNFSQSGYWGEAPTISPRYGEYDNGEKVFNSYANFSGFSLPEGWSISNMDNTISNGVIAQAVDRDVMGSIYSTSRYNPETNVLDADAYFSSLQGNGDSQFIGWDSGDRSNVLLGLFNSGNSGNYSLITSFYTPTGIKSQSVGIASGSTDSYQVWSIGAVGTGYASLDLNYQIQASIPQYHISTSSYLDISSQTTNSFIHMQWIRVRTAPPNGVMPSAAFGPPARPYYVIFKETGLPAGTSWTVTLNGISETSVSQTIRFAVANGTYSYAVQNVSGFVTTSPPSTFFVEGQNESVSVIFSKLYPVTFLESGLPAGTEWNVTLGRINGSSFNSSISFELTNGTYYYLIPSVYPYNATVSRGSITVNGEGIVIDLRFVLKVQFVFIEVGLPSHSGWSIYIDGAYHNSTSPIISVNLTNGTYSYIAMLPSGYTANPLYGKVSWNNPVAIINVSPPLWYEIAISSLVILVIIISFLYVSRIRRRGPSTGDRERKDGTG